MQRRRVVAEFLTLKQWEGLALAPGLIYVLPNCPVSPFGLDLLNHPGNTSTTLLGIWQLRDWYGNTSFCHSHPLVTASAKVVTLEERWERFLLQEKKKNTTVSLTREKPPDLPCERLPWPQVCSEHRGQWWVWKKSPTRRTGLSSGEPSVTEAGAEVVMGKE